MGSPLLDEGIELVRERMAAVAAGGPPPGRYQVLAATNAVHVSAPTAADTDWTQIVTLYDQLARIDPSPIVRLNRAIALAEFDGPDVALAEVERLTPDLDAYHALHVARGPSCCAASAATPTRWRPTSAPRRSPQSGRAGPSRTAAGRT